MCLFYCFCFFLLFFFPLVLPDLDVSRKKDITQFLLMLQYVCFLWRINMARGLTNNKIISTVEFITTMCKLLLSFQHYLAALVLCRGAFLHICPLFSHPESLCALSTQQNRTSSGNFTLLSVLLCSVTGQVKSTVCCHLQCKFTVSKKGITGSFFCSVLSKHNL